MSLYARVKRRARRELLTRTTSLRGSLRTAVIGCGQIAPAHLIGYAESGLATVLGVSDIDPGAMAAQLAHHPRLRAFRDYRQMLSEIKPDIVSICTWPQHHLEVLRVVAEHPVKGVLCEKPMALEMHEVEKMLEISKHAGIRLGIGHQYRFHPYFRNAAQLMRTGALGRILSIKGNIADSIANNGPHLIDTIRFLLDDKPVRRVLASIEGMGSGTNRGWPAERGAHGEMTFDDGLAVDVFFGSQSRTFFDIEVAGEKGALRVNPDGLWLNGSSVRTEDSSAAYWCLRRQFTEFARWVSGRESSYAAAAETSARSTELVLAMYESARQNAPVDVPLQAKGNVILSLYRESGGAAQMPAPEDALAGSPIARTSVLAMDGGPRAVSGWPASTPHFGWAEAIGLGRVLLSKQMSCAGGTEVAALEKDFARVYDAPKAVASTSGTAAIHVAVAAINPEPYDEIITTPMSDMGTVIPILLANCVPIFADIDPVTGNLTADTIAKRITKKTRAVIVVHLFGRPAEMTAIQELLRDKGIALIEDCAQAHFAEYGGRKIGTFGDLGCFSLQQSKPITCGDGGLTLVNREDLVERASLFVDKGRSRKAGRSHFFLGANYRMTELQGAVARAQLRKGQALIDARRTTAAALTSKLRDLPGLILPKDAPHTLPSWWIYNFMIEEKRLGMSADHLCAALQVEGVPAIRRYLERPLFEEDVIAKRQTFGKSGYPLDAPGYTAPKLEDFPGLNEFFGRQILLSWNSRITPKHVDHVAEAIGKVLRAASPGHQAASDLVNGYAQHAA